MSNATIRPSAIYLDGKKVATLTGSTIDGQTNDQRQLAIDGYIGHSDGIGTTDIDVKSIIIYGDTSLDQILDIIFGRKYCEVQGTVGSRLASLTSRCVSYSITSEVENGKLEGDFKFEGGEAKFV